MANFCTQKCPLCGVPAEYCWVDAGNRKYFECDNCTRFQISKRAEEILSEQPQECRDSYASQAPQAPAEYMFAIVMPDANFREISSAILKATFVAKADLPLECE